MHVVLLYVSSIAPAGYKQDGRSRQLAESQALTMAPSSSAKQLIAVAGAAFLLATAVAAPAARRGPSAVAAQAGGWGRGGPHLSVGRREPVAALEARRWRAA